MKIKQKMWCVLFLHSDGWTISTVESSRQVAFDEMQREKKILPNFEYRIAPCDVHTETLKAPFKGKKGKWDA